MTTPAPPTLDKQRHVRYWLRCLKSCLPEDYTPTDLNRMTLGCFSVAALDLLGELPFLTSPEDRAGWIEWVYRNQLPGGGFRGSPATDFGPLRTPSNSKWDPPNLSASFFAVATLVNLGDNLARVERKALLRLLPCLQRDDGSFGETLVGDEVIGATDMRFVYMAAALRWMLRGQEGRGTRDVPDFDLDKTVAYIRSAQTYDCGVSEKPFGESHAGMTYCAVAALSLLGHLNEETGLQTIDGLTKWLVHRQVPFENKDELDEDEWAEVLESGTEEERADGIKVELGADGRPLWGGFHGRCNKNADTCYSFWIGASLDMLKKLYLIDVNANRRFLLEKTRHIIGGFMKLPQPGGSPDILHSFLGLAALSLMREEGLNRLDAALCISFQAKERLMGLDWWGKDEETAS